MTGRIFKQIKNILIIPTVTAEETTKNTLVTLTILSLQKASKQKIFI